MYSNTTTKNPKEYIIGTYPGAGGLFYGLGFRVYGSIRRMESCESLAYGLVYRPFRKFCELYVGT